MFLKQFPKESPAGMIPAINKATAGGKQIKPGCGEH
jgi:hypothetical protein